MLKITSVICLILLSIIVVSAPTKTTVTKLDEFLIPLDIPSDPPKTIMKSLFKMTRDELRYALAQHARGYQPLRAIIRYLVCALNIRYSIELFPIKHQHFPEAFVERQQKINLELKEYIKKRTLKLGEFVKGLAEYSKKDKIDENSFSLLWNPFHEFVTYTPPEGNYSLVKPLTNPVSNDVRITILELHQSPDVLSAFTLFKKQINFWIQIQDQRLVNHTINNTLQCLCLPSGSVLTKFAAAEKLTYEEQNYVIGVIQSGMAIRQKSVDKKYHSCFWVFFNSDQSHDSQTITNFITDVKQEWNDLTLKSEIVDRACRKMVSLYNMVSHVDFHGSGIIVLPPGCKPTEDDYRRYIERITIDDKEVGPIAKLLVGVSIRQTTSATSTALLSKNTQPPNLNKEPPEAK